MWSGSARVEYSCHTAGRGGLFPEVSRELCAREAGLFVVALVGVTRLEPHWKGVKRNSQKAYGTSLESSRHRGLLRRRGGAGGLGHRARGSGLLPSDLPSCSLGRAQAGQPAQSEERGHQLWLTEVRGLLFSKPSRCQAWFPGQRHSSWDLVRDVGSGATALTIQTSISEDVPGPG